MLMISGAILTVITENSLYFLTNLFCQLLVLYKLLRFYEDLEFERLEIEYSESGILFVDLLQTKVIRIKDMKEFEIKTIDKATNSIFLISSENPNDEIFECLNTTLDNFRKEYRFDKIDETYYIENKKEKNCLNCKNIDIKCHNCYNFSEFME